MCRKAGRVLTGLAQANEYPAKNHKQWSACAKLFAEMAALTFSRVTENNYNWVRTFLRVSYGSYFSLYACIVRVSELRELLFLSNKST